MYTACHGSTTTLIKAVHISEYIQDCVCDVSPELVRVVHIEFCGHVTNGTVNGNVIMVMLNHLE